MENLQTYRLQSFPPFLYVAVDYLFLLLSKVLLRVQHIVKHNVIFICLANQAVFIDLADGHDAGIFILVLRRFISIRRKPRKNRSDSESQLVFSGK